MGVDYTTYLVHGVKFKKIEYTAENEGLWDQMYAGKHPTGLDLIHDGMCGQYTVIGKILARADEEDCGKFTEVITHELDDDEMMQKIAAVCCDFGFEPHHDDTIPSVLFFIHAS